MIKVFNARSNNKKIEHENDHFQTPIWCIEYLKNDILCDFLKEDHILIDFCCGKDNRILENLKNDQTVDMFFSDIENEIKKDSFIVNNFMEIFSAKEDKNSLYFKNNRLLASNPPFNKKDLFIEKYMDFLDSIACNKSNSKVALLLPTVALNGKNRAKLYERYTPDVYPINPRPQFVKNKSSNLDCSWFIFSRADKEQVYLIDNDKNIC